MKNDNTIDDGYLIIIEFHNNTYIYCIIHREEIDHSAFFKLRDAHAQREEQNRISSSEYDTTIQQEKCSGNDDYAIQR